MQFSVLSSGSKANSTFVEAASTRILIDCGLSARRLEERLALHRIDPATIQGILITHEHSDHILGLSVFSRRHRIPVYANRATARHLDRVYALEKIVSGESFWVGALQILPVSIEHDADDPVGYVVQAEGLKFSQMTDLGRVTPQVEEALRGSWAFVLESNHDQIMLRDCSYPYELKRRIASSQGHLDNDTSANLVANLLHGDLQRVVLGHLSENSNTPEKALETFRRYVPRERFDQVMCASVHAATPLFAL
ncbi:MAG: MBL fold metallo-hydrolase [Oligoflexia bacterium]|nr:MBL fold metallo-hydrolase [Oligoflexia bacterium]